MAVQQRYTLEQFEAFIHLPENSERLFEYIGGEIVQVPSNPYVSKVAARIITFIGMYLLSHDIGHLTAEAGGFMVSGERYTPDVAFISYDKQPELATEGYNPNPPDLAVENISSKRSDERDKLRIKTTNYLAAGTEVWIVNPTKQTIEVHRSSESVRIYHADDTLSTQILPDFEIEVHRIF